MNLRVGMRVLDTYTGTVGTVVALNEAEGRATVRFKTCLMTGCASWFKPVREDAA